MTQTRSVPSLTLGPRVRGVVDAVRSRARVALAVRGLASVALLVVALSLLSFGLDRLLRLAWSSRAVILVVSATMIAAVARQRLVRPLTSELPDDELARVIEGRHPALEWRLMSAVQFADPAWAPGPETSRELAEVVIKDAEGLAGDVDPARVVPTEPTLQAGLRGGVVLLAGALLALGFQDAASTWFQRNVRLSTTARWPQDTTLRVDVPGLDLATRTVVVPHGSDLAIVVSASGVIPARVYVETRGTPDREEVGGEGAAARDELLVLDALGEGRFRAVLDEVTSAFEFTVRGGDAEEGPFAVRVIRRPWVEALTFRVTQPPHTGLPERTFGVEAGSISLPVGSRVQVVARVSKPLREVTFDERQAGSSVDDVAIVHTATLGSGGFASDFVLERTAVFKVDVIDQDGLGFAQPVRFSLVAQPDRPPDVQLGLVGIGLNVTPQALLRARVAARDDYGVATARLRLKVGGGGKPEREHATALPELTKKAEGEALASLELPELELVPKMSITLWAEAFDADPRGPNSGTSPAIQLRVVTQEQLLGELLRRLHEQRLELERMVLEEEKLSQGLAGQDQATLERASRAHRDVGRAVLRAADVVDGVVEEMVSNRLLDESTWDRLREDVVAPLRALQAGPLQEARDLADKAAQAADDDKPQASLAAGTSAAVVAQELRSIVARMGRIEELAELVAALKKIIEKQKDLLDRTRNRPPR